MRLPSVDWHGAHWIWRRGNAGKDEYVDFLCIFDGLRGGDWHLNISADSDYNVYINGQLAAFGQYPDYPACKVYDRADVSRFVHGGQNRMVIRVWYYGVDSQTYVCGDAGLIFALECGGKAVAVSSVETMSRLSHDYVSGKCKSITSQLGLTYCYDSTEYDGYLLDCDDGFEPCTEQLQRTQPKVSRPVKKLELGERLPFRIVNVGSYCYSGKCDTAACRMRDAIIYPGDIEPGDRIKRPAGRDGIYIVVDVGVETAGFLDFDITVPAKTHIDIGYGEHLNGGICPVVIGGRNFSAEYIASPGRNRYMNTYRRFGGRYVQFFVPSEWLELEYLGIRPTMYPVRDVGARPADALRRRIYDVCVNTLRLCMHEHYEDCPWREQALYTMDSRNQMLCGYYAFGEYEFPRASLWLISQGVRPDGLLSLCYPAGLDYPIPSFSLIYFIQMLEYTRYSGDTTLAEQLYPMMSRLMHTFTDRVRQDGLVPNFEGMWNFYEWSRDMSGRRETDTRIEAPLNALLVLALTALSDLCRLIGKTEDATLWSRYADNIRPAIAERFYDGDIGLFRTSVECDSYSVLTNALCLMCGAANNVDFSHVLKVVADNCGDSDKIVIVPATLSMNCFRFDALLSYDRQKYGTVILNEIDRVYGYMLRQGATSFWETISGADDFGGAGSLCHGWSALPIYYYSILDSSINIGGQV